ncbi:hybrid sensor histidine kinase/response regulator [Shimia abyssi]|uniref:histidine kinase n=1 Tax=Shimia abyssi TaxID=1662395 RepID=A0A2P8FJT7_9RHOB|nr:PAS domain-containing hybrid sensor histidine kinase/response regulator [Shimia abyssi]PSL21981.1 PAS/PAC sensor hybrid histidine kinase [Shimia abyssi]
MPKVLKSLKYILSKFRIRRLQGAGLVASAAAIAVIAVMIFIVAGSLRQKIDDQATATADTSQWSLAQTEVDLRRLQFAVLAARDDENTGLDELRNRFDIFYSRVATMVSGQQFAGIRNEPDAKAALAILTGFLDTFAPIFDNSDAFLRQRLPEIEKELHNIAPDVRRFSLTGVREFAKRSDAHRNSVGNLLGRIAFLTIALVAIFFVVVLFLLKLVQRSVQAESAAAESRNHIQEVISTSIDGILTIDTDGHIIDYNGAAERIFGYTRQEAIGQLMSKLVVPEHLQEAHEAGMARYRQTGEHRVVGQGLLLLEAKRKDGSVFPVELSISSATANGKAIFVSYLRDISKRVEVEKELIETRDKAVAGEKAKADLIAVMSHEMRTPLNGLIGTMELLGGTGLDTVQSKYLSGMETSANLLLHHVNGVLSMSSADSGLMEIKNSELEPTEFLEELVESQRPAFTANGNNIVYDANHAPNRIWVDRVKLLQVVLNLVANANKFTKNGEISVDCDQLSDGETVEFRVTDTGIGIAPEHHETVFEDFRTLDTSYGRMAEGSGLGLGISRRIVSAMGGTIGLESEPGVGSIFWIRLPIGKPVDNDTDLQAANIDETTTAQAPQALTPAKILVVEDNEINRLVAMDMLEQAGHLPDVAHDGVEGVQMANTQAYDLILMDISMPELDGVEASGIIRNGDGPNRNTPILALTAHALPQDQDRFHRAGISETIVKPLTGSVLMQAIKTHAAAGSGNVSPHSQEFQGVLAVLAARKGPDAARKLVTEFIHSMDQVLAKVSMTAIPQLEREAFAALAHKCAGSASVLGCEEVARLLGLLEDELQSVSAELRHLEQDLSAAWIREKSQLAELLPSQTDI